MATQASRSRTIALETSKAARQGRLPEWNFSGNIARQATIGLISKRKQSTVAQAVRGKFYQPNQLLQRSRAGNKENSQAFGMPLKASEEL